MVPLVNHCLNQYLPQYLGPHASLLMLAGSITMLALAKYIAYQDQKFALAKDLGHAQTVQTAPVQ